ncbi:hypothetical protein Q8A73_009746 [Channa argus]|nr:hypothetical protein Q8A73_009746 [Channa argus]
MVDAASELVLMTLTGEEEVSGREDVVSRDVVNNNVAGDRVATLGEMGDVAEVSNVALVVSKLVIKACPVAVNVVSELVITISEAVVGVEIVKGVDSVVVGDSGVETVLSENKVVLVGDSLDAAEKGVMVEAATELVLITSTGAAEVSGKEDVASRDVNNNVAVDEIGDVAKVSDAAVLVSKLVIKACPVAVNVVSQLVITISNGVASVVEKGMMVEAATELVLMISMGAAEVSGKEDVASRDVNNNVAVDEIGDVAEVSDSAVDVSKLVIKPCAVAVNVVSEMVITISEAVVEAGT